MQPTLNIIFKGIEDSKTSLQQCTYLTDLFIDKTEDNLQHIHLRWFAKVPYIGWVFSSVRACFWSSPDVSKVIDDYFQKTTGCMGEVLKSNPQKEVIANVHNHFLMLSDKLIPVNGSRTFRAMLLPGLPQINYHEIQQSIASGEITKEIEQNVEKCKNFIELIDRINEVAANTFTEADKLEATKTIAAYDSLKKLKSDQKQIAELNELRNSVKKLSEQLKNSEDLHQLLENKTTKQLIESIKSVSTPLLNRYPDAKDEFAKIQITIGLLKKYVLIIKTGKFDSVNLSSFVFDLLNYDMKKLLIVLNKCLTECDLSTIRYNIINNGNLIKDIFAKHTEVESTPEWKNFISLLKGKGVEEVVNYSIEQALKKPTDLALPQNIDALCSLLGSYTKQLKSVQEGQAVFNEALKIFPEIEQLDKQGLFSLDKQGLFSKDSNIYWTFKTFLEHCNLWKVYLAVKNNEEVPIFSRYVFDCLCDLDVETAIKVLFLERHSSQCKKDFMFIILNVLKDDNSKYSFEELPDSKEKDAFIRFVFKYTTERANLTLNEFNINDFKKVFFKQTPLLFKKMVTKVKEHLEKCEQNTVVAAILLKLDELLKQEDLLPKDSTTESQIEFLKEQRNALLWLITPILTLDPPLDPPLEIPSFLSLLDDGDEGDEGYRDFGFKEGMFTYLFEDSISNPTENTFKVIHLVLTNPAYRIHAHNTLNILHSTYLKNPDLFKSCGSSEIVENALIAICLEWPIAAPNHMMDRFNDYFYKLNLAHCSKKKLNQLASALQDAIIYHFDKISDVDLQKSQTILNILKHPNPINFIELIELFKSNTPIDQTIDFLSLMLMHEAKVKDDLLIKLLNVRSYEFTKENFSKIYAEITNKELIHPVFQLLARQNKNLAPILADIVDDNTVKQELLKFCKVVSYVYS